MIAFFVIILAFALTLAAGLGLAALCLRVTIGAVTRSRDSAEYNEGNAARVRPPVHVGAGGADGGRVA
jgi:hypothetical protein